jgi:glutamate N-acetyltransferase/amino-acid N-acetyltransferase
VRFATAEAGIRYKGRTDVLLMLLDEGTQAAGVFTRRSAPRLPVDWCRANLKQRQGPRAGRQFRQCQCLHRQEGQGLDQADRRDRAKAVGCKPNEVFLASTGVIGEPLDATKFEGVLGLRRQRAADGPGSTPPRRS